MMEADQVGGGGCNYTFPPGFRFHPSDEELIIHYLQNKINSNPLPAPIVAEIDLYKFNPWELPSLFFTFTFVCVYVYTFVGHIIKVICLVLKISLEIKEIKV